MLDGLFKDFFKIKKFTMDLLEVVLCDGMHIFKVKKLQHIPTEHSRIYGEKKGELEQIVRIEDLAYIAKCVDHLGKAFEIIVCLEFQDYNDPFMVIRFLEYLVNVCLFWLNKMRDPKDRKLPPPVLILVYSGKRPFRMQRFFSEILKHTPDFLRKYVLQLEIVVVDLKHFPEKLLGKFCTELGFVVNCNTLSGRPRQFVEYVTKNMPRYMSPEGVRLLSATVDLNLVFKNSKGGKVEMCRAVTYWQNLLLRQGQKNGIEIGKTQGIEIGKTQGIEIGKTQGIEIGKTQGIEKGIEIGKAEVLKKAVALGFGKDDIQRLFGISSKEYLKMVAGKA